MNLYTQTPRARAEDVPYWFSGPKVKVTMQWLLKMFLLHNCFIFTPIIMKLHTQTPHELKMCPIDVRFQRSRSKYINVQNVLKMVFGAQLLYLYICNHQTSIHTQNPSESRIWCPNTFGVKNLEFEFVATGLFIARGQSHSSSFRHDSIFARIRSKDLNQNLADTD